MMTRGEPFCIGLLQGRGRRIARTDCARARGRVGATRTFPPAAEASFTALAAATLSTLALAGPKALAHRGPHGGTFLFVQLAVSVFVELLRHFFAVEPTPAPAAFATFAGRASFTRGAKRGLISAALAQRTA